MEDIEPGEQYTDITPTTYKAVGRKFGISPLKLQHTLRGLTGGLSDDVVLAMEGVLGLGPKTRKIPLARRASRWTGVKAFIGTRGSQQLDESYDVLERVRMDYTTKRYKLTEGMKKFVRDYNTLDPAERRKTLATFTAKDRQTLKRIVKDKSYRRGGAGFFRSLKSMGSRTGERAEAIAELMRLVYTTPEQRAGLIRDLTKEKVLDKYVVAHLATMVEGMDLGLKGASTDEQVR
jgi:hypothetical protein